MQRCIKCKIDKDRCDCEQEQKDEIQDIVYEMERIEKRRVELYRRYVKIIKERGQIL